MKSGPRNGHNYTDIETQLQYTPFHFSTIHDQYNFTKVQKYKEVRHSHSLSWTTCDVVINSIVAASCLLTFTVSPLLAGTNLYYLVITGTCVQMTCLGSLPVSRMAGDQPLDHQSNALSTASQMQKLKMKILPLPRHVLPVIKFWWRSGSPP